MAEEYRVKPSASSPAQAMDRGVGFWKTLAWAGLLLAGAIYMVDPVELFASSVAPICFVAADSHEPGSLVEIRCDQPAHFEFGTGFLSIGNSRRRPKSQYDGSARLPATEQSRTLGSRPLRQQV